MLRKKTFRVYNLTLDSNLTQLNEKLLSSFHMTKKSQKAKKKVEDKNSLTPPPFYLDVLRLSPSLHEESTL
jgi:hypothetical protein